MKKINFGIVLIVITLILFILFVIYEYKQKDKIKEVYNNYLTFHNKYSNLDNCNCNDDTKKYDNYLAKMKQDLSYFVLSSSLDEIYGQYKDRLDKQFLKKFTVKEYEQTFIDFYSYKTDNSNIYVTAKNKRVNNISKNTQLNSEIVTNKSSVLKTLNIDEYIIFKKVGNDYKIVKNRFIGLIPTEDDLDDEFTFSPFGGLGI